MVQAKFSDKVGQNTEFVQSVIAPGIGGNDDFATPSGEFFYTQKFAESSIGDDAVTPGLSIELMR